MQMCPECSSDNKVTARFCIRCGTPLRKLRGRQTVLQGRYRLERVLGCGGMGAVYLATDLRLGAKVAVKENLDMTSESRGQFETEARLLATLRHPHLPRVQDFFLADGRQYLVMDYIAGESLEDLVTRRGPLPPSEAMLWLRQIMDAVRYLHSQNPPIIHRDIKPANIKLGTDGRAYLVDFGIAKMLRAGSRTQAGARAVTPGYSPPEQYGTAPTDQRSDIYALGATLYFAVTGQVPPEAIERVTGRTDKLVPPRNINPLIPPNWERVILKAMHVHRNERYGSLDEMLTELMGEGQGRKKHPAPPDRRPPAPLPSVRPSRPAPPPVAKGLLAPSWARLLAFGLDGLLWAATVWGLTLGYAGLLSATTAQPFWWVWERLETSHWLFYALAVGWVVYRVLAHALSGRTVGKAMLGLRVVLRSGKPCGVWRVVGREMFLLFAGACCGLGLLWMVFDPYKQGWHDLVASTFVVREETTEPWEK